MSELINTNNMCFVHVSGMVCYYKKLISLLFSGAKKMG